MARRNDELLVGLDIGTTKICAVVGEITEHGIEWKVKSKLMRIVSPCIDATVRCSSTPEDTSAANSETKSTKTRNRAQIESTAPEATVRELLDTAERHSPYLDVFQRAQSSRRTLRLNGTEI